MPHRKTQVLVIGGGPVGLSTVLHLDAQGVDCVLVKKHPSTATHPKASYFNVRTMELLRKLGVAEDVYATAMTPEGVSFYTKICGYKLGALGWAAAMDHVERLIASTASPGCVTSQIVLEAILREHAERAPHVTVLFHHEKTAIEQDDSHVRARILDRASGETFVVGADYAIACEGVRSSKREALGRKLVGPPLSATRSTSTSTPTSKASSPSRTKRGSGRRHRVGLGEALAIALGHRMQRTEVDSA